MYKEFIPYAQSVELKELGFNEECAAHYLDFDDLEFKWNKYRNMSINESKLIQAPTYSQAFRFFRDKYNLRYSIGYTNIVVVHFHNTTNLLQDNKSYEDAELACINKFIEIAKQL